MQKLQQKESIEQQIYIKSRLIHNLQNYFLCNQKQKECQIKNNPQDAELFLKEQCQLKIPWSLQQTTSIISSLTQKLDQKMNI